MALEVRSGSGYLNAAKAVQKPDYKANEGNVSESGVMNIKVTETPATAKSSGSQTQYEQEKEKEKPASEKQIKDAISRANDKMKSHRTKFEFSYHEETKRVSIKVLDKDTEEVIREIPPEETLEMIEKMWELAGLLIDERR